MKLTNFGTTLIEALESVVALAVLVGIFAYFAQSVVVLSAADWGNSATFQELIERVLLLLVGVEILQILRVHEMRDIFLVSVFILSRKALNPDTATMDIIFLVSAIVVTISAWSILTSKGFLSPRTPL